MAEWHFEHPDQPHPMSGKMPDPDSGVEPWVSPARQARDHESESDEWTGL